MSNFSMLDVPRTYAPGMYGPWELFLDQLHTDKPVLGFTQAHWLTHTQAYSPVLRHMGRVWMSGTPMERESLSPQADAAYGHTVIMGLGLGILLFNVVANPKVKKVTVVESSLPLITHFKQFSGCDQWKGMDKVSLVHSNAFKWSGSADVVLVDIWEGMGEPRLEQDVRRIRSKVKSKRMMAWGQELCFIGWAIPQTRRLETITQQHLQEWCRMTGLWVPNPKDYLRWAQRAAIVAVAGRK